MMFFCFYTPPTPFKGIKLSIPENNPIFINKKELIPQELVYVIQALV
ncbi:MAG: hypothetical protein JSW63_01935 [Ignavibacterium sp.]|nr:MAG: hypothetical protein JSW63_01935 [Ignavibacterium sp.]